MDYIQIDRTNWMEIILQEFPAFRTQWDLHLDSWSLPFSRPIALDISEFADFAIDTICLGVDLDIEKLATITELILQQDDAVLNYAFRTMFLERIAHQSLDRRCSIVRESAPLSRFIHKLQPLGYYHWQAMDRRWNIHPSGVEIN